MKRRLLKCASVLAAVAFLAVFYGLAIYNTPESDAVKATDFKAGRIIDDAVFYNANTMSVADIQAFLDAKLPTCDMWGRGSAAGRVVNETGYRMPAGSTNADYARARRAAGNMRYHEPPYVCVNKYYENPNTHETLYETNGVVKDGMISAAQIIYNEAKRYNINPQVLLVLLKKESYVWGDSWPLKWEYNTAMGYGCPDNAPCDTAYYGFYNQIHMAAYQFNRYKERNYEYNYHPGMTNNIYYSPTLSCGTKQVYIENIATASLYIYTPYTPNDAALANYPGTSNCGSYGNRNFFMYFSEWFGSTYFTNWVSLDTPRYMKVTSEDAVRYNVITGEKSYVSSGSTFYFSKKAYTSDGMCLRPEGETNVCIYYDKLSEISWEWGEMATPRYMTSTKNDYKINSRTLATVRGDAGVAEYYDKKMTLPNGVFCLKIAGDASDICTPYDNLVDTAYSAEDMAYSRKLSPISDSIYAINPTTLSRLEKLDQSSSYEFSQKIIMPDGKQCLLYGSDVSSCVLYDDLSETIQQIGFPRELSTNKITTKYNSKTGVVGMSLDKGLRRVFVAKTFLRTADYFGVCYQTEYDDELKTSDCIKYEDLDEEIYEIKPKKTLSITDNTYKVNSITKVKDTLLLIPGLTRNFVASTFIKDDAEERECYFTEYDSALNTGNCIETKYLKEAD